MNAPKTNNQRLVQAILYSNLPISNNEVVKEKLTKHAISVQSIVFADRTHSFDASGCDIIIALRDAMGKEQINNCKVIARKYNRVYAEINQNQQARWNSIFQAPLARVKRRWNQEESATIGSDKLHVVKTPIYEPEPERDAPTTIPTMSMEEAYNWVAMWEEENIRFSNIIIELTGQLKEKSSLAGSLEEQVEKLNGECAQANLKCANIESALLVRSSMLENIEHAFNTAKKDVNKLNTTANDFARENHKLTEKLQAANDKISILEKSPKMQDAGIKSHLTRAKDENKQLLKDKRDLAKINEDLLSKLGEIQGPNFNETRTNALRALYELGDMGAEEVLKRLWSK